MFGRFPRWVFLAAVVAVVSIAASAPAATPPTLPGASSAGGSTNGSSRVGSLRLHATLDSQQMIPAPSAAAANSNGVFNGLLRHRLVASGQSGGSVVWNLSWSLSGLHLTGTVTAVEIRSGRRGEVGPIMLTLCQGCGASAGGAAHQLTKAQVHALQASALYVSVTTAANPGGEVRGQLTRANGRPAPTAGGPTNGPLPGAISPP